MKVLQLGKFFPVRGGVEKVMFDLTKGLSEKGIPCDMLCASLDKASKTTILEMEGGGRVIVVPTAFKAAGTMIAPKMVSWLWTHERDYDIIHIHHPDPMAAIALRMSGFKGRVILHWHSDILSQRFFLFFYKPLQSWLIRRAEKIVGTTPVYVAQSPFLRKVQDKTTFVPIGIEPLKEEKNGSERIKNSYICRKLVFSLGRLVPYKGYDNLIDAAALLPEGYKVVIGGTGPLRSSLQERIDQRRLGDKVALIGYVEDKDVTAWFAAADVFVLCSVMKTEAFGIVQIEAMSMGVPVVATKISGSGVSWVNEDGVSGINVPPGDPKALSKAILSILEDERTHHSFREGARRRYDANFGKEMMITKITDIYEKNF